MLYLVVFVLISLGLTVSTSLKRALADAVPWRTDVHELLESNGWTETDLIQSNTRLSRVEIFLASFNSLSCLHLFSNIITLQILGQQVPTMEHLGACKHLEHLWIIEGSLTSTRGLRHLHKLTHLYLYANAITVIEDLDALEQLQVLWLAGNRIMHLDGVDKLVNLRELHLADNPITSVGSSLDNNTQLQVLNLSQTDFVSFRETAQLSSIRSLRELHFNDPNWGAAPISKLCNYQTMLLVQLPSLSVLDYLAITADHTEIAQGTYIKKRMYYNMCGKALGRIVEAALRQAHDGLMQQLRSWFAVLEPAVLQRLQLELRPQTKEVAAKIVGLLTAEDAVQSVARSLQVCSSLFSVAWLAAAGASVCAFSVMLWAFRPNAKV
jgi:hypothetical protein